MAQRSGRGGVLFVQEAPLSGGGASENCRRKVKLIRQLVPECRILTLSVEGSGMAARLNLAARYLTAVRSLRRVDTVYLRLVPRALVVAGWAAIRRRSVILEANGRLLDNVADPRMRSVVRVLFDLLSSRRNVQVVGDLGHRAYYVERWPGVRWATIPLGVEAFQPSHTASASREVVFGGTLTPLQGVDELASAFLIAKTSLGGARLRIFGSGPAAEGIRALAVADPEIEWSGTVAPDVLRQCLSGASVLVAPYPRKYLDTPSLSSLKVLEYALTDRVIVVPERDSVVQELGLSRSDGVITWDGQSVEDLAGCLVDAMALADRGQSFSQRRDRVLRSRGPEAQLDALRAILVVRS
jgi:glycosyltransferase involved in cell wall biosynthesis